MVIMDTTALQPRANYPAEWREMSFDDFATLKRGKDLTREHFRSGTVPVAGSNGVIGYHDTANVKAPGVTVGRSGSVGKVSFFEEDYWAHNTALFVADFHGNDPRFAGYFLRFLKLGRFGSGVSVPTLDRNVFRVLPVVVPILSEQRKIASVLILVQRAIEQQDRLIALTTELKKSLMHKLFAEGIGGERQKQTEIGPMPESWEVRRLSDLVLIKNGQVDPRLAPYKEMIHVGPENIESDTGRLLNLQSNERLRISSGNYHFTAEDVLYSKIRPYLNKAALPAFEGTCSADMYPIRPKDKELSRDFLFQLILSDTFRKQAVSYQDRTGIPKVNRAQLGSLIILKPSFGEQTEIAKALTVLDERRNGIHRKRATLNDLFRTLLHQLMTAQIRVHDLDLSFLEQEAVAS